MGMKFVVRWPVFTAGLHLPAFICLGVVPVLLAMLPG
jgi:hypothetical protein